MGTLRIYKQGRKAFQNCSIVELIFNFKASKSTSSKAEMLKIFLVPLDRKSNQNTERAPALKKNTMEMKNKEFT